MTSLATYDRGMQPDLPGVEQAVDRTFREESGRIVASLIRVCRDFDLAEDAMQDAFTTAMQRWPLDGIPENAGAWITTTARLKLLDRLRRQRTAAEKEHLLAVEAELAAPGLSDVAETAMDHP